MATLTPPEPPITSPPANPDPNRITMPEQAPVITGRHTYGGLSQRVTDFVVKRQMSYFWLLGVAFFGAFVMLLGVAVIWLFWRGVGIWGIEIPVGWGFAIANFVWWIGIGHAGTLISAVLWLTHQEWRTSINRFAEAMTLFAVACAGLFPLIHLGRPEYVYFLAPYPNTFGLWPQFRSPLVWDFAAVSTYLIVSIIFWYIGLLPDLATVRDRAKTPWKGKLFGWLSLGWRGEAIHWLNYHAAYVILAGLATPLVVSVHSIVALDFAVGIVPGWHSTLFPPYFVAGAVLSGFAMVLTLTIPLRYFYKLHDIITTRHLENCAKMMIATGAFVSYGYIMEFFTSYYSGDQYAGLVSYKEVTGHYWPAFAVMMFCNVLTPQLLWFHKLRTNPFGLWILAGVVQVGMWTERFVIVISGLHAGFMPSAWGNYHPTIWDYATLFGTIGLFFFLFLLFIRVLPMTSLSELRKLIHETQPEEAVNLR